MAVWSCSTGGLAGVSARGATHRPVADPPWPSIAANRRSAIARPPIPAELDIQVGRPDPVPRRPAESGRVVTGEIVTRLCERGQLDEAVEALGVLVQTDSRVLKAVFYALVRRCVGIKDLVLGRRVHALTVENGYESDTFLCNHILRMYASNARLQEAMDVFTIVGKPDAFMWSSIISAYVKHGHADEAIQLYQQMRGSEVKPDCHVFVAALQACARGVDLQAGQQVHADVMASGVEPDLFVSNCLVDMYAKCGSLEDAQRVFDGLGRKDVVTWNAMLTGYYQQGMGQEALLLYSAMQQDGVDAPDCVTFVCLLQACASVGAPALETGKQLHRQIEKQRLHVDVVLGCSLVNMYAKCGMMEDAQSVFDRLGQKDVVTCTTLLAGYSQQGMGQEALHLYSTMQQEGIASPDSVTFVCLLHACATVGTAALETGREFHRQIEEQGIPVDAVVGCSLVNMYAKCGSLEDAQTVFDRLPQRSEATWTALIVGYSQQAIGQKALDIYNAMQEEGVHAPDSVTFVCLLQACASVGTLALEKGKELHRQIEERGFEVDVVVGCSLVNMYAKCGSLQDAQAVFDRLPRKNEVTWTALIVGYSQQGMGQSALDIFSAMQDEGVAAPDTLTFVCLLQACSSVGNSALEKGKQLHALIGERGLEADMTVANNLISMYTKCGSLKDAQKVFDSLSHKDAATWTALIAGYSQQGMGEEALHLYSCMQDRCSAAPTSVTFVSLLQACASVGPPALGKGKQLHAQIRDLGLDADVVVGCSLLNMYAKCGSVEDAQDVFDKLPERDVVTWTALIAGYSQQGMSEEALRLYGDMQQEGISLPGSVTFACLLQACATVAALQAGRQLHAQIVEQGLQADAFLAISLLNMYAKSGSMDDAQQVFDGMSQRDIIAWNSLIAGYTRQGESDVVFALVQRMEEDGLQPNSITFLSLLTVCSHAGLVTNGREYFDAMTRRYGITPTAEHYSCLVDLLGRAGHLDEALAVVRTMPVQPSGAVWHALLGACQKWSNLKVALHAFHEAVKLDSKDAAAYVLMANTYAGAQMWQEAKEMQKRRKETGAWKEPGQTWWTDMDGVMHTFRV